MTKLNRPGPGETIYEFKLSAVNKYDSEMTIHASEPDLAVNHELRQVLAHWYNYWMRRAGVTVFLSILKIEQFGSEGVSPTKATRLMAEEAAELWEARDANQ